MRGDFRYSQVAVGGTFDIIHGGHARLLARAFELGRIVVIGVTSDSLVPVLLKDHPVQSFHRRERRLREFLRSRGWLGRARIVELTDPYGPAVRLKNLEALVVSEKTRISARKVNSIRASRRLKPLRLHVVRMVKGEDGKPISTSRILKGEIDVRGHRTGGRADPPDG